MFPLAAIGCLWRAFGILGPTLVSLCLLWEPLGPLWVSFGPLRFPLECPWAVFGRPLAVLGHMEPGA